MHESPRTRAPVDRAAARRNYLMLCVIATIAVVAMLVLVVLMYE